MRVLIVLFALAACLPRVGGAQGTPEAAAEAFGAAIIASDWPRAARLMHPNALRVFRGFLEPLIGLPDASPVTGQLFGVRSLAELAATPDTVLFARLLQNTLAKSNASGMLAGATIKALGHITQPGDTVLVVSRMTLGVDSVSITSYELMPMLLYNGAYRGLLKADVTNLLAMLKARFTKQS